MPPRLEADAAAWQLRERFGFRFERLDRAGIEALEPGVAPRYQAGVFLADHATIRNPARYTEAIAAAFVVARRPDRARRDSRDAPAGREWLLSGAEGRHTADHVVVAAGAWSRRLLDPLGVRLQLESQRGYHVQFTNRHDAVSRTVVLTDRKIFVTPMEGGLRVGGTVEIAGPAARPDPKRAPSSNVLRGRHSRGSKTPTSPPGWATGPACRIRCPWWDRPTASPASGWRWATATWG